MALRMRESGANPFIRRNDRRISTQSRAEVAAPANFQEKTSVIVLTHSRAKAAATILLPIIAVP